LAKVDRKRILRRKNDVLLANSDVRFC